MRNAARDFSARDRTRMARALDLAAQPFNACDPNPRVGCVIAADGQIVGEGWHRRAGDHHAEIAALRAAGTRARGATVYVTLEPCCHEGRTGPCTDALIEAGVARVVAAMGDPHAAVDGGGFAQLRAAGIDVGEGLCAGQAQRLNRGFVSRHRRGRPFVTTKIATSLDGRTALADGTSKWITSPAARADVQQLRARASAVLTGVGTVLADNPSLDVRLATDERWHMPARIVADSALRTPPDSKLLAAPGDVRIFAATGASTDREQALAAAGATVHRVADGLDLTQLMVDLAACGYNNVLVEAGATLNGALLEAGLIDEIVLYQAPVLLGADARPMFDFGSLASMAERPGFVLAGARRVGPDWRLCLHPRSL